MPSLIFLWKAWVYLDFWLSEHNCTLALESQWLRGGGGAELVYRFVGCLFQADVSNERLSARGSGNRFCWGGDFGS